MQWLINAYDRSVGMYEELINCFGTITFNDDGTFIFHPNSGRKRYYNARYSTNNKDRALKSEEFEIPTVIQITVPGSAPYNWYRKS